MKITHLDHFVLTVRDLEKTIAFYCDFLGMSRVEFGEGRVALAFGKQKINLHVTGKEFEPKANNPTPGSADLCFIVEGSLDATISQLQQSGIKTIEGPVMRTGAHGAITSIYIRDPDLNLIELSAYE